MLSLYGIPYESAWSDDLWQSAMGCHLLGIGGCVCFLSFSWCGRLFLNDAANMEILKLWVVQLSSHPWCVRGESVQVATCVCGILSEMDSLPFQAVACWCFSMENEVYLRTYAVPPVVDCAQAFFPKSFLAIVLKEDTYFSPKAQWKSCHWDFMCVTPLSSLKRSLISFF